MRCPRCGYDLRGAVATWRDACPLDGVCTECGLAFRWAEVLCPRKFEPPWCVEFSARRRLPRAVVETFLRSWRPFRFWSALGMSMPIRRRRLVIYVAAMLTPLMLGYVAVQTAAAVRVRYIYQQEIDTTRLSASQQVARLRQVQAQANLTPGQRRWIQREIRSYQPAAVAKWGINHSYGAAIAEAVLLPWRSVSWGSVSAAGGIRPYPAPRELHAFMRMFIGVSPSWLEDEQLGVTVVVAVVGGWIWLVLPPSFVLLPVSRRRANVRWGHLWRVTAYAAFLPAGAYGLGLGAVAFGYAFPAWAGGAFDAAHALGRYLVIPLLVAWWAAASGRYLRLPHAWAVAGLLSVLVFLLLLAVVWIAAVGLGPL